MNNANRAAKIELNIDELLLYGFRQVDGVSVSRSIRKELIKLLAESNKAFNFSAGNTLNLDVGSVSVQGTENGEVLGVKIAKAIHENINKYSNSIPAINSSGSSTQRTNTMALVKNMGVTRE